MKSLKEKVLHIADSKWHLPFVVAVCFNLLNYILTLLVEELVWLSSSQIDTWELIVTNINIGFLIILIILIIYHLIKRRWIRAFITTIYSVSHSGISFFISFILLFLSLQRGCNESVSPCKCKNANEDTYLMDNCKNHIESLSEDLKNKWLDEQKKCDETDENINIENSSVIPNDKVVSQKKVLEETNTSITNEIDVITWSCFKSYMVQSDIADKDLIIRVLEMYSDTIKRIEEMYVIAETYSEIEDGLKTWSCD